MKLTPARSTRAAFVMSLTAALCTTMLVAPPANAAASDQARTDAQTERLYEISQKYTVGDELSAADADFIKATATNAAATRGAVANCFRKSGSGAVNGTGTVDGCHGSQIGPGTRNNWMAGYTATGNANVTKIKAAEHVRAYGLIGSGGIGVVYASDPSATVNGRTHKFSRSATFTALAAYMTVQYDATFYTSRGSFNVTGG